MDLRTAIAGFLYRYRWELWLVIAIPIIARVIWTITNYQLDYWEDYWGINWRPFGLGSVVSRFVTMLFLFASYPFVHRIGREFLTLLWGFLVVESAIGLAGIGAHLATGTGLTLTETIVIGTFGVMWIYGSIASAAHLLALLWFARQASRLSLTHACFLVVFVYLPVSGFVALDARPPGDFAFMLVGGGVALCVMLVRVCLLGNFDARGSAFRKNAVIGLVAATVAAGAVGALIGQLLGYEESSLWVSFFNVVSFVNFEDVDVAVDFGVATAALLAEILAVLGIVWLIRVREPRVEAPSAA